MKRFSSFLFFSFLFSSVFATTADEFSIRHKENKGIGYEKGYTTAELFFTPLPDPTTFLPFFDLRGHVFDNGKYAANAGLGLRSLFESHCLAAGIYGYFDYRHETKNYLQASLGMELLSPWVDFRVNGYLPFGKKKGDFSSPSFYSFQGNNLLIKQGYKHTLSSVDAEIGSSLLKNYFLYVGAGPYYLHGCGDTSFGGKGRILFKPIKYVALELSGSYDKIFHGRVQGLLSFIFPFGGKKETSCEKKLGQTFTLPPHREEIIPLEKDKKISVAINPDTGNPFHILFVNNQSHSSGTFENPYSTLAAAEAVYAPHDIIYVFSGDGTDTGMDDGIELLDYQRLLGAGTSHVFTTTKGNVTSPILSSASPKISNAGGLGSITIVSDSRSNVEINGIDVSGGEWCLSITKPSNLTIANCNFSSSEVALLISEPTGTVTISGNTIQSSCTDTGMISTENNNQVALNISNNRFYTPNLAITSEGSSSINLSFTSNNMVANTNGFAPTVLSCLVQGASTQNATISNNSFLATCTTTSDNILNITSTSSVSSSFSVLSNTFERTDSLNATTFALNSGGAVASRNIMAIVTSNTFSDPNTSNSFSATTNSGFLYLRFDNNESLVTINPFLLTNTSGTFDLEYPTEGNDPEPTESGTINHVPHVSVE